MSLLIGRGRYARETYPVAPGASGSRVGPTGPAGSNFLIPAIQDAAGATVNLLQAAVNNRVIDSTGDQVTEEFPVAPNNGDVVILSLAGGSVPNPVLLIARGGFTIEDPGNPGNFSAEPVDMTDPGQKAWFQFQSIPGRWKEIV
jgi:hypothetical protein